VGFLAAFVVFRVRGAMVKTPRVVLMGGLGWFLEFSPLVIINLHLSPGRKEQQVFRLLILSLNSVAFAEPEIYYLSSPFLLPMSIHG